MIVGIFFVIAACFCWGLIFVIPKLLSEFNAIEIAMARYLFFGVVCFAFMLLCKRHLFKRSYWRIWPQAVWYAFISTLLSYTCVVFCIQYANPAVAALIFGMSPITIALCSNWYRKEYPFRRFLIPVLFMLTGLILVNLDAFHLGDVQVGIYCLGLLCGIVGLAAWTLYTISNFHFMANHRSLSPNDWVIMQGVGTFFLVLIAAACLVWLMPNLQKFYVWSDALKSYLLGGLILGVVSSWIAYYFWTCGNLRLPIALAGQLSIFEMIFGLLFVYVMEKRFPLGLEIGGFVCMLTGVLTAFKVLKQLDSTAA